MLINLNKQQLKFALITMVVSAAVTIFGIASSGAGHGPYPRESIGLALLGFVFFCLSVISLLIILVKGSLSKDVSEKTTLNKPEIPSYDWWCPRCDALIKANIGTCEQCGYETS